MVSSTAIILVSPPLIISLLLLVQYRAVTVGSFSPQQNQYQHRHQHQHHLSANHHQRHNTHNYYTCASTLQRRHRGRLEQQQQRQQQGSRIMIKSNLQENTNYVTTTTDDGDERDVDDGTVLVQFPNLSIIGICGSIGTGKSYTCSLLVSKLNSLLSSSSLSLSLSKNGDNDNDGNDNETDGNSSNTPKTTEHIRDEDQVAFHIDTDSLAHGVYKPGSLALKEIEHEFGKGVIRDDGTVDRKVLGGIVFNDEAQMATLERIVWPHVKILLLERLSQIEEKIKLSLSSSSVSPATSPATPTTLKPKKCIVVVEAAVLLDANWDDNELFDAVWVVRSSSEISTERLVSKRGMDREDALKRMEAQLSRRGIGNLDQELSNGSVTAVIQNDGTGGENRAEDGDGNDLWNSIQQCLTDPESWKDNRCPTDALEHLFDFNET